jgi:phosphate transport system substrate-binding protein
MARQGRWAAAMLLVAVCAASAAHAESDVIAVIVNMSSIVDELSMSELRRIYQGQKTRWNDGSTIMVVNRPSDSPIRAAFYRTVLDAEPAQEFYQKGSPIPFKTLHQESDISTKRLVARMPNAIGYIRLRNVDESVKVLAIDGARPAPDSDNSYPLRW